MRLLATATTRRINGESHPSKQKDHDDEMKSSIVHAVYVPVHFEELRQNRRSAELG